MDRKKEIAYIIEVHEGNYLEHLRHGIDIDSPDEIADQIEALLPQWIPGEKARCEVRAGWYNPGREGRYLGKVTTDRDWAIVLWDNEEDPDLFKMEGLEISYG